MWRSLACFIVLTGAVLTAGCGNITRAISPPAAQPAPPTVAVTPISLSVAEKIGLVSDALRNTLPALGVSNPKVIQGLEIVDQLADISTKLKTGGGGSSVGTLVLQASSLIERFSPVIGYFSGEYKPVVDAAVALLPKILDLAGIERAPRMARSGTTRMTPDQAESILLRAARRG